MPKIIRNAIRCKKCGEVIESETVHDFKFCSCGSCASVQMAAGKKRKSKMR